MSRIRPDQLLLPSILDRLIDFEPDVRKEVPRDRAQLLSDLKLSVRRDLENLLNTRINITSIPEDMPQLKRSLVNYGIPDFGRTILESGTAMESLRNRVEEAIRMYETRFKHVHVDFDEKAKSDRTVRFVIDGVLHAEPYPEPVVYRSQLNTLAREFRVLEANP